MINWEKAEPFIKQLYYVKEFGISPWACFTHAVHETAFFNKVIGDNNYFGIKKPSKWTGKIIPTLTHEFENGKKITSVGNFIDWDTVEGALVYYCDLVKRLYPNALKCNPCAHCFFDGLVNGTYKWATDPLYARKLRELYELIRKEDDIKKFFNINLPG